MIILATASLFVPIKILHPFWMIAFLLMTAGTFSLFGFIIGIWAKGFEHLQFIPMLIITPLTFLGGAFYSIDMLPPAWRTFSLFNPIVYLISGFRWSFYGAADVSVGVSIAVTVGFFAVCLARGGLDIQDRLSAEELRSEAAGPCSCAHSPRPRRPLESQDHDFAVHLCRGPDWRRHASGDRDFLPGTRIIGDDAAADRTAKILGP